MKITVELESTYFEGNNLDEEIAKKIKKEVVREVFKKVKGEVESEISAVAKAQIEETVSEVIVNQARAMVKSQKMNKPRYSGFEDEKITFEQYMESVFSKDGKLSKVTEAVEQYADEFVQKLKDRYDMAFATQVINKMRQQDLLKDNVETALFKGQESDNSKS